MNMKTIKVIIIITTILLEGIVWVYGPTDVVKLEGAVSDKGSITKEIAPPKEDNSKAEEDQPLNENGENIDSEQEGGAEEPNSQGSDTPVATDTTKGNLILVNKQHYVDKSYKPEDLKEIKYYATDRSKEGRYMRAEAADAFHKLSEEAAANSYEIVVTTAYRSYGFQSTLYNNYVNNEGQEAADRYSAAPGTSEHQTGLAADVSSPSVGYKLTQEYGEAIEGKWLAENAHKFGFIIRFPQGSEDITGYMYEPWHIRYVGLEIAAEIYKKGITLEEYLGAF